MLSQESSVDTRKDYAPVTLTDLIERFLADLRNGNRSVHTLRSYRVDLTQFSAFNPEVITAITVTNVQAFLDTLTLFSPATRAHKQAALASFFEWTVGHGLATANPMAVIQRVKDAFGE